MVAVISLSTSHSQLTCVGVYLEVAVRVQQAVAEASVGATVSVCGRHMTEACPRWQVFFHCHEDPLLCEPRRVVILIGHRYPHCGAARLLPLSMTSTGQYC